MIYLNIGSNLPSTYGNRLNNIEKAIFYLKKSGVNILKTSSFYETPSYPNKKNPKFINISIKIKYDFNYTSLFKIIKLIEKKMGRTKSIKNSPRVCDIDIIDFNKIVVNNINVTLPHPRLHIRNFVLFPLYEIEPNWTHPIFNKKIGILLSNLSNISRMEITRLKKDDIII